MCIRDRENSDTDDNSVLLLIIIPVTSVFIMLTFVNINDHYTLLSLIHIYSYLPAMVPDLRLQEL